MSTLNPASQGELHDNRDNTPASWASLVKALEHLVAGDGSYRLILLRPAPLDQTVINCKSDIDLLCSPDAEPDLLKKLFDLVRQGLCHVNISRNDERKTKLTLFSIDGSGEINIDLWKDIWQTVNNRRIAFCSFDSSEFVIELNSLKRIPVLLESSIYIQHIYIKRKKLGALSVQNRLDYYHRTLQAQGSQRLAAQILNAKRSGAISEEILESATTCLDQDNRIALPIITRRDRLHRGVQSILRAFYSPPKRAKLLMFIGCDGVGKTSLARNLVQDGKVNIRHEKGKSLYRRSVLYNLLMPIRPLIAKGNAEEFEEKLSGLLYVVACGRLRLKLLFRSLLGSRSHLILDRSPTDLLFHNRKSDCAAMRGSAWLEKFVGVRPPVVHFIADYDCVAGRKREVTPIGHAAYDESMVRFHQAQIPVDYTLFWNGGDQSFSVLALSRVLRQTMLRG